MKKIIKSLLLFMILLVPVFSVKAENSKVNLYVFYNEQCNHCTKLHLFIEELQKDDEYSSMFNLVDMNVADTNNLELMDSIGQYFNFNIKGVPFYVVGESYFSGFSDSKKDSLKSAIKEAYEDKKYKDIVADIAGGNITDESEEAKKEETTKKRISIIILFIIAVLVVAVIIGRKNTSYTEETEVEEEEVIEEVKKVDVEIKKTNKKKSNKKGNSKKKKSTNKKK